jgi:hypothetical protein
MHSDVIREGDSVEVINGVLGWTSRDCVSPHLAFSPPTAPFARSAVVDTGFLFLDNFFASKPTSKFDICIDGLLPDL